MGDYYAGRIEIEGFPRAGLAFEHARDYSGGTYERVRFDLAALSELAVCPCCELAAVQEDVEYDPAEGELLRCSLCEEESPLEKWGGRSEWEQLAEQLGHIGAANAHETAIGPEEVDFDGEGPFGRVTLADSYNGGIVAFEEGTTSACRELGLAYYAEDDGGGYYAGRFVAWRPGWDAERNGTVAHEEIALTSGEWQAILANVGSLEGAARAVGSWFDSRAEALGLHPVARALEDGDES